MVISTEIVKDNNMAIKHYIGIPLQIIGSIIGLFIFVVAESYKEGQALSELDNEYIALVANVGSISVIVASLVYYFVLLRILKSKRISDEISYFDVVTSGFLLGFIFLPSLHLLVHIQFPISDKLHPLVAITAVLTVMSIISIAVTMTIFLILISKKKIGDKNNK